MKQSATQDLAAALDIIARHPVTHPNDLVRSVVCAESAIRINQLVSLTNEMRDHILSNPIHHNKCNAKTKGSYCSCILARLGSQ
jgi:hypothetical protein